MQGLFGAGEAFLQLHDGHGDFAEARFGHADDGHVLDGVVGAHEVFYLHGVDVFAAGDDHVLLAVNKVDEAVLVHAGHVAGVEPAVLDALGGGLLVLVVAEHDARAAHDEFAHVFAGNVPAVFVHDAGLPQVAGLADGAHLVQVLHAEVYAAGADGFGKAVVRVVLMVGEVAEPAADEAGRHGLGADVHEAPLVEIVVGKVDAACVHGVQQVLRPRHEQPHDGALFLGHGAQNPFGLHAAQEHGLGAGDQRTEPVHLGAGVVERRDAEEHVVVLLAVVGGFGKAGIGQRAVGVQNGLGEAGSAGGEIDGGVVVFFQHHGRGALGAVVHQLAVGFGKGRHVRTHVEQGAHAAKAARLVEQGLDAAREFRAEDQHVHVRKVEAVGDFFRGVAEVQRHGKAARLEDAEIDGEPFKAVHQEYAHLGSALDAARKQEVGKAVGLGVELGPGELAAVREVGAGVLDKAEVAPRHGVVAFLGGVDLHKGHFIAGKAGVFFKEVSDDHEGSSVGPARQAGD